MLGKMGVDLIVCRGTTPQCHIHLGGVGKGEASVDGGPRGRLRAEDGILVIYTKNSNFHGSYIAE